MAAKHELWAAKPAPRKPRAEIRAAPSSYEVTHPVGSAERFLDQAAKEALAAAAAGGVITPRQAAIGAVRAIAKEAGRKYPDRLLEEAARLPKDELLRRAARAEAFRKAMDAQNKVVATVAAVDSPVGRMVTTLAAADAAEAMQPAAAKVVRQTAKGGDTRPAGKPDETFDTPIPKELRARYDAWYAQLPKNLQYTGDYDLQGAWLERLGRPDRYEAAQNGHLDDYGKKPNHITFSTGSKWHDPNVPERTGGEWRQAKDGSWDFYPGTGNKASDDELKAYFEKYEKGNRVHGREVRQAAGGGYSGGRNTVSRVEARNTTKRERERVAAIEAALREERRPKLEARVKPSRPTSVLRAPRNPFPQTLATSLGAEVDPMETAKAGYQAIARGEMEDPVFSPGVARVVSAVLAGYQGLETAAGLTGIGNPNRIAPPEIRAPGHSLGARGAEAGYLAEKLGVPVTEVLKAKATEGKDLTRASTRRAAQAKAQQASAKMRNKNGWLEHRADTEDSARGVFEPPLMLDQAKRGSTVARPSKAKAPSDIWVSTAQRILDQLASGQSMSEISKTIPKEITDKLARINGGLYTSLKAADDSFAAMRGDSEIAAGLDPLMNQRGTESAVYSVLNRVLGSRGVDLEPGVYDFLANAPGLHKLKARVLSRPDIPKGVYDAFLMSDRPSDLALTTIAQKPDLSDSQVELLLRQGSPFVRAVVASRNDLSETGVRWLWQNDPSSLVRKSIASRKGLPDDIVRDAVADKDVVKDPFVQLRLVSDKRVPSDLAFGILTGQVPHDTSSPVSKLVIAQAANRPDLDMPGVLRQLYSDAVAARSAEQAQHIPEHPASDIIAPQDGKVSDGVLDVAKYLKRLAPYLARQVDLALTDSLPAGSKRNSQARARRAGLLAPVSLGTEDQPVETFRLFHRAAEALDAARVKRNPAYELPDWMPSDGEAVIPDVEISGNVKHTFESYLDYFSGKRAVAAERKVQAKQYDGTPLGKAYQKELRRARKAGLDHVPMVLQRGVPLSRGEKDIMIRGLESPSMYAIDAFRLPSVSKGFRTNPEDYNMPYLVYQMKPDQFAVGRKNLTYTIGADGGTGESADLSTLRNQAGRYMREFGTMPSMDALRHMVTGRQKRQRFAQILEQDDSPAGVRLRKALQKELLSEGSVRGSSQSRAVRRAYEDYIADSWYDKTGLFSDAFDKEQRLINFDHAKRAEQGHRHRAPEFFTRSAKGDHPVLPLEGQKFMHQAMYDHPGTYAEVKSLKAFPVDRLSDAIGNVLFVWDDAAKNTPVDHPRIIRLQEQLDSLGITYENVQGDEGRVKAQQTSPFQMDAKGGNTRADNLGGDTPGAPGTRAPGGSATVQPGGPRIVINPRVFEDRRDALCVAFNEAFRVVMEDNGFEPVSEPTDRQRKFFADTAYADDELQLRRTILARIATLDTSVKDPTDEQLEETAEMLEMVMEVGAPQNEWERQAVRRLRDVVAKAREGRAQGEEEPLHTEP